MSGAQVQQGSQLKLGLLHSQVPEHTEGHPTGKSYRDHKASNLRPLGTLWPWRVPWGEDRAPDGRAESPGKGFGMHFKNVLKIPVADPGIEILGKKRA